MKKLITILLALSLAASLAACTNSPESSETPENDVVENDVVENDVVENDVTEILPEVEDEAEELPEVEDEAEELPEEGDVVIELPAVDAGNEPAMGTEEENTPAVMPEVTPEAEVPEAKMPEVEIPEVEAPEKEETPAQESTSIDDLYAIADKLYEGINPEEMPMVGTIEIDSEGFEYSAFVPYKDTYLAVESMPMMGSQPHSVVIVDAGSEDEAKALCEAMKENANPRKWICVQARSVKSAYKGSKAILVMTSVNVMPTDEIDEAKAEEMSNTKSEERASLIIDNFLAAVK